MEKGLSSGSFDTNLQGTLINATICYVVDVLRAQYANVLEKMVKRHMDLWDLSDELPYDDGFVFINHTYGKFLGDDGLLLCDQNFVNCLIELCKNLGMVLNIKHISHNSKKDIFFLGRYWDEFNIPFQTELYLIYHIAFRSKFYNKKIWPEDNLKNLSLYRVLSICLPLKGGKEFLDKYFYDWEPYKEFLSNNKGFFLLKEWPDNDSFRYISKEDAFDYLNY
jgi:hypothetical protein